jgi:hypothetical protein
MSQHHEVVDAIADYSRAYARLEELQEKSLLPRGGRKKDCIGEFYARLYLRITRPTAVVVPDVGGPDLEVVDGDPPRLIQVRTVSVYSVARVVSPVHDGSEELWVILLDKALRPTAFWIVEGPKLEGLRFPARGIQAPDPEATEAPPGKLVFGPNRIAELLAAIGTQS